MKYLSSDYTQNIQSISTRLRVNESFDLIERHLEVAKRDVAFFYIDGFVKDGEMLRIMQHMLSQKTLGDAESFIKTLPYIEVETSSSEDKIIAAVLSGQAAIFSEPFHDKAVLVDIRTYPARTTAEPDSDRVMQGAHDGFVETVVMNLLRGSGLRGMCGIPAVRDNIVRPLIDCSRDDIEKYCRDNSIPFVTDKTNFEDIYSRNKIRLNVIPQLKKINPAAEKAIASFAADSREIYSLLSQLSDSIYRQALGLGGLEVSVLSSRHPAVVKNLIRNNLDKLDCLSKDNVEAIYNALGCDSFKRQLSATVFCRIRDGRLSFYTPKQKTSDTVPQSLAVEFGTEILFGYSTLRFSVVTAEEYEKIAKNCKNYLTYAVNYDILKGVLKLRSRKTGDRFTITGRNVTKTLKKLFIEDKVPQDFRDRIPVLCDETDAVVWLGDYGTNKPYVPDENTKNILLITQI